MLRGGENKTPARSGPRTKAVTEELVPPVRGAGGGGRSPREPGGPRGDGEAPDTRAPGLALAGGAAAKMEPPPEPHNLAAARSEQRIMAADWSQRRPGGSDSACSQRRRSWRGAAGCGRGGSRGRAACGRVAGRPQRAGARVPAAVAGPGAEPGTGEPPRGRPPARPDRGWRCCPPRRPPCLASPRPRPGCPPGCARGGWRRRRPAEVKVPASPGAPAPAMPAARGPARQRRPRSAPLGPARPALCAIKLEAKVSARPVFHSRPCPSLAAHRRGVGWGGHFFSPRSVSLCISR